MKSFPWYRALWLFKSNLNQLILIVYRFKRLKLFGRLVLCWLERCYQLEIKTKSLFCFINLSSRIVSRRLHSLALKLKTETEKFRGRREKRKHLVNIYLDLWFQWKLIYSTVLFLVSAAADCWLEDVTSVEMSNYVNEITWNSVVQFCCKIFLFSDVLTFSWGTIANIRLVWYEWLIRKSKENFKLPKSKD